MKKLNDIEINEFQLNVLLSKEQREFHDYIIECNVYCTTCRDFCKMGVDVIEIILNSQNDIIVNGICKVCSGKVTRLIELGENDAFYHKANIFRKALFNHDLPDC